MDSGEDAAADSVEASIKLERGAVYQREFQRVDGARERQRGRVTAPRYELWRLLCVDKVHDELVFKKVDKSWDKVAKNAFQVPRKDAIGLVDARLLKRVDDVRPQFMYWDDVQLKSKSPKAMALQRNRELDDDARREALSKWLVDRDGAFEAIKPLVVADGELDEEAMLVRAYSPRYCSATVASFARLTARSQLSVKRLLHRYAWFGTDRNAMLKHDASKGTTGPLSRNGKHKSGPRDAAQQVGGDAFMVRSRNKEDLAKFLYALTHYWADQHKSMRETYRLMIATLYVAYNKTGVHSVRRTLIPTERMFRYAAKTLILLHKLRERRAGHKDAMGIAPRRGYDTDIAPEVGSVFDIDGTPFNRELVCRYKVRRKRLNIGKAYVVLIFERRSKKCVGWHVYLGNENWKEGYRLALFCAISSKAERLKWLRIYAPKAWPEGEDIRPAAVYVDGGPGASKRGRAALKRLNIDFFLAPPDTPYWKPAVEGGLGHLQAAQAQSPGGYARTNDAVEKSAKRLAKLHANATLWEFERALVLDIIDYNARIQERARLLDEMKMDGVMPTANDIFHWGVRRMGGVSHRRLLAADAFEQLLDHESVVLTRDGVRTLNARYQSALMERHFMQFGKCRIDVFYDPLRPKVIYWRTPDSALDRVERDAESQRQNRLASAYDMREHRLHFLAAAQMETRRKPRNKNVLTTRQRDIALDAAGELRTPTRKAPTKNEKVLRALEAREDLETRPFDRAENILSLTPKRQAQGGSKAAAEDSGAKMEEQRPVPPGPAETLAGSQAPANNVVPLKRSRSAVVFEELQKERASAEDKKD